MLVHVVARSGRAKGWIMKALLIGGLFAVLAGGCSGRGVTGGEVAQKRGAALALAVGPEIGTDPPVPIQSVYGRAPDVASDGTTSVAVFDDSPFVRAVRVDAEGSVLDMPWLQLGEFDLASGMAQSEPSVAFGGDRYLVVWTEFDGAETIAVKGRLMRPDGTFDGASFPISPGSSGAEPSVAWNGEHFVVAWTALLEPLQYDVRVTLVDAAGQVVSGSEHTVSTGSHALRAAVAAGTNVTVVAWEDQTTGVGLIRAARISDDGSVQDPGGIRVSDAETTEDEVEIASSGTEFLVAWRKEGAPTAIRASIFSETGAVTAKDFVVSRSTVETGSPSVAFDGARYLVAWADDRDDRRVFGAAVSTAGVVGGAADTRLAEGRPWQLLTNNTTLTWTGSGFFLAFQGNGIEGSFINPDLTIAKGDLELSPMPNKQGSPSVAWTGENYVVAWIDEREPAFEEYSGRAVRIDAAGRNLDPDGLVLSADETAFALDTASNGNGSDEVVWANAAGEAWRRSLASDGTLSELTLFEPANQSTSPAIATNGDNYLVVSSESASTTARVTGRILDASGSIGAPFAIEPSAQIDFADALSAGEDYLVRYRKAGTWLVPVSRTGAVGTPLQLSTGLVQVSTATNGAHTLVVWTDVTDAQVRARLYTAGAWQGDAFSISTTSAGYGAAVAWDGSTYWVIWENDPELHPLWARPVSASGQPGEAGLLVADDCNAPALASDGNGQMLLSYYKYSESSRVRRVVSRLLGRLPPDGGEAGSSGGGGEAGSPPGPVDAGAGGSAASAAGGAAGSSAGGRAGASAAGSWSGGSTAAGRGGTGTGTGGAAAGAGAADPGSPARCSVSTPGSSGRTEALWLLSALVAASAVRSRRRGRGFTAPRAL
jgi:hypothetical protein